MKQVFRIELDSEDGVSADRVAELIDEGMLFVRQSPDYHLVVEVMESPVRYGAKTYQRASRP